MLVEYQNKFIWSLSSSFFSSKRMKVFSKHSSHHCLHLLVLQAIDERIQHGSDHAVLQGDDHLQGRTWGWQQIAEETWAIKQNHSSEVGGAGREGFTSAWGGADAQDGGDNTGVREEDEDEGSKEM